MSTIADLARLLTLFFSSYLMQQRQVTPNTIASYRDTFRLLVNYANKVLGKPPQDLSFEDLDADFIGDFLNHLEHERGNDVRTRNARRLQFSGREAGCQRRGLGQSPGAAMYLEIRHRQSAGRSTSFLEPARGFRPQNDGGPCRQGRGDEVVSVHRPAGVRHEQPVRPYAPTVRSGMGDFLPGSCQHGLRRQIASGGQQAVQLLEIRHGETRSESGTG